MYDFRELSIKMVTMLIIYIIIYNYPKLNKYSDETKFSVYRSFMCLAFTLIGAYIVINYFSNCYLNPFSYYNNEMDEVHYIFMAYLIIDIIKLIANKSTRIDLYLHHILAIATIIIALTTFKFGYFHCLVLISECISIVSGIDSIAMEDNDEYLSYKCKKIRKNIINYIRLPIWIIIIYYSLKFKYILNGPTLISYGGLLTALTLVFLDRYWINKCNKVINKYE